MAPGLGQHTVAGVDQDDCEIAIGGAGGHVAGVLFVAGGVGDDELTPGGGKIAVGDVDGNALFAFCLQAVDEQRQVEIAVEAARARAVGFNGGELVFVDLFGIVQQAADQGALAVVDAAAGEEAQQFLALVLGKIGLDVGLVWVGLPGLWMQHLRSTPGASSVPSTRPGPSR